MPIELAKEDVPPESVLLPLYFASSRPLTDEEQKLILRVEALGRGMALTIEELRRALGADGQPLLDHRWVSIGQTHLQQGQMALIRSITGWDTF